MYENATDAPWQDSVRDNSTVHSDSRIRINVEGSLPVKPRRRKIDFTTGGKCVKIIESQPRARLTKEALATTGECRDLHGYKVDDMAFVEPDFDQYDYAYEDDDHIEAWGAPYSRMLENESSSQQLLPPNDYHEGSKDV